MRLSGKCPYGSGELPICLRALCAMSGTEIARFAICLRTRYAVSITDRPYGAMRAVRKVRY